ncbi:cytochrome P450, family 706, subfamily A, polypeptide 6 [Hibiscus trionum]|uniref:Cytochrome P450, family 706, subfamily A, polypeptide 6 n=1 Tax=Hibiscus trionum TaxID=183268 RepID=A0A9W7MXM3_HIBTR|nr:cytochrome P450, family 706, subfamily A, polypeptide 6 [Hibiscus trionum]
MMLNIYESITSDTAATLMAAAIAVLCFAWWWGNKFNKINPPLPPGPRGLPILGNLPFIKPELHSYFRELSETYGPIFKLQLGKRTCIVINSPSIAKEVLKDQDAIFANRDTPAATVVGTFGGLNVAWRQNGPEYSRMRKFVIREMLSKSSLDACYALRRREILQMVKDIHGKTGSSVKLGEQVALTTVKVMISSLWGGSSERSSDLIEMRTKLEEFVRLMGAPNVSDILPVLAPFDLQGIESKSKNIVLWFYGIFESVIRKRLNIGDDGSKDFLQLMLEMNRRGDAKTSLTDNEVKALLLDMMIGGTDTIPTTVEWAMTELLRHPDIMTKLVSEVDTVAGNENLVEDSHLPQLTYLEAIVKETLRLHPVAPLLLPHMSSETSTIGGYTIPKHSKVFINAWAMQRNPELWDDPLCFQPERFLKADISYQGNNLRYIPFGSGRRICAGIAMAEKMVGLLLAVLVHSFEWKLPEEKRPGVEEKFGAVLKKMDPLVAIPFARLSDSKLYQ